MRHSSTSKKVGTYTPRSERRLFMAFCIILTRFVIAIVMLGEERVAVALLLEAGEKVPEGS
jgi:hypothetical protein